MPGIPTVQNIAFTDQRLREFHQSHGAIYTNPGLYLAAADAYLRGHCHIIPDRSGKKPYLSRFWLSTPQKTDDPDSSSIFDSADSVLLHYFHQGDDDGALHDHPWSFTTTILSGGYTELRPTCNVLRHESPGPDLESGIVRHERRPGDKVITMADQLHAVIDPLPGTWTLVNTTYRCRDWGFHPPGRPWIGWRAYLDEKIKA